MKLQSVVACALVAACAVHGAAAAAIARTAPLAAVADGLGGFNAHFGDTFSAADGGAGFTDIFTFDAGTRFDAAASLTSAYLDSPQTKDLAITALSLYRYDPATGGVLGTALAGIDDSGSGAHPTDAWSLGGFDLAGGAYAIRVDGVVNGVGGGMFGADMAISPVPEAPVRGMLMAGVSMVAALASRRRAARPVGRA